MNYPWLHTRPLPAQEHLEEELGGRALRRRRVCAGGEAERGRPGISGHWGYRGGSWGEHGGGLEGKIRNSEECGHEVRVPQVVIRKERTAYDHCQYHRWGSDQRVDPEFKPSTLRLLQEESAGRPCTRLSPCRTGSASPLLVGSFRRMRGADILWAAYYYYSL